MSVTPEPPHAGAPTTALPLVRATPGQHRAAEDGRRLMWLTLAGAAVVVLIAALSLVLAGGGDSGGARPEVGVAVPTDSAVPDEPSVIEEPTPTAVPSSSSPAPRPRADPAKLLAGLGSTVDGLVRQGELRRKDGQDLHKRLRDAERSLTAGDVERTRAKLREFTAALVDLRSADGISPSGYETLVAGTTRLAQALPQR